MNDVKSTVTACIAAALSVGVLCATCMSVTNKSTKFITDMATATTRPAVTATQGTTVTPPTTATTAEETTAADTTYTTEATEAPTSKSEATTKKTSTTTKKAVSTTKKKVTTTKKTTTKKPTTTAAKASVKTIINDYNAAVNKAINSKAGYTKSRTTTLNKLEGGALLNNNTVKGAVSDFLGVGTKTFTNSKGKSEFMSKASLTEANVKSAERKTSGDNYIYTIVLNNGTSSADGTNKNSSPVDKSGILVGSGDKSAYDHKSAPNLYAAINGTKGASVKSVSEKTSNVKINAVVNKSTGKISSLTVSFDFAVSLTNTKYILTIKSASGTASTSVKYSSFKW